MSGRLNTGILSFPTYRHSLLVILYGASIIISSIIIIISSSSSSSSNYSAVCLLFSTWCGVADSQTRYRPARRQRRMLPSFCSRVLLWPCKCFSAAAAILIYSCEAMSRWPAVECGAMKSSGKHNRLSVVNKIRVYLGRRQWSSWITADHYSSYLVST